MANHGDDPGADRGGTAKACAAKAGSGRSRSAPLAPLWGLILAGGRSSRMGQDKGSLEIHEKPQARFLYEELSAVCERVFVSVSAGGPPRQSAAYDGLPLLLDEHAACGPMSGIVAAFHQNPSVAWLVIACDIGGADRRSAARLVARRSSDHEIIAYASDSRGPIGRVEVARGRIHRRVACRDAIRRRTGSTGQDDRTAPIEPLFAIWEPTAQARALRAFAAGEYAVRRATRGCRIARVSATSPEITTNLNTPADLERFRTVDRTDSERIMRDGG